MNWQDISTAPQDGTEVLCWREDCGPFIAKYTSVDSFPLTQAEIDAMDEESLFHKDWFTQWPQAFRLDGSEAPTHWMPLPAAPGKEAPAAPAEADGYFATLRYVLGAPMASGTPKQHYEALLNVIGSWPLVGADVVKSAASVKAREMLATAQQAPAAPVAAKESP